MNFKTSYVEVKLHHLDTYQRYYMISKHLMLKLNRETIAKILGFDYFKTSQVEVKHGNTERKSAYVVRFQNISC